MCPLWLKTLLTVIKILSRWTGPISRKSQNCTHSTRSLLRNPNNFFLKENCIGFWTQSKIRTSMSPLSGPQCVPNSTPYQFTRQKLGFFVSLSSFSACYGVSLSFPTINQLQSRNTRPQHGGTPATFQCEQRNTFYSRVLHRRMNTITSLYSARKIWFSNLFIAFICRNNMP